MADCMEFPRTAKEFIEECEFKDLKEAYTNGSMLIPVFRVEQLIDHYFNTKPESTELSAEDFVKAINANLDMLITISEEKRSNGSSDETNTIMLKYVKKFINDFVDTSIIKTEDIEAKDVGVDDSAINLDHTQPTELLGTIPFMTSDDYKNRFKAEYFQLSIRIDKLERMLKSYRSNALDFTPACSENLLKLQLRLMKDYYTVLEARARIENIRF